MRPVRSDGSAPLSDRDRMEMLTRHIPYRKDLLTDGVRLGGARCWQDNQAAEAGIVSGRILLSFLGLGFDRKTGGLREDRKHSCHDGLTDDVKAPDVGGRFAELDELSPEEAETLARFIQGANKACTHFTINSGHALTSETHHRAVPIICRLLTACLLESGGPT
jgi:hypothetical protein